MQIVPADRDIARQPQPLAAIRLRRVRRRPTRLRPLRPDEERATGGPRAQPLRRAARIVLRRRHHRLQERPQRGLDRLLESRLRADELRDGSQQRWAIQRVALQQRADAVTETFQIAPPLLQQRQPIFDCALLALGVRRLAAQPLHLGLPFGALASQLLLRGDQ